MTWGWILTELGWAWAPQRMPIVVVADTSTALPWWLRPATTA